MGKTQVFLIIGQIFGLAPIKGLWGSGRTVADMKYRACSFISLYSRIWLVARFLLKVVLSHVMITWVRFGILCKTDFVAALAVFITTFCTGFIYQWLVLNRIDRFVTFLKTLARYDEKYPRTPGHGKERGCLWGVFPIVNLIFTIFTIGFPAATLANLLAMMLMPRVELKLQELNASTMNETERQDRLREILKEQYEKQGMYSPEYFFVGFFFLLFISEIATVFPVFQLSYAIKAVESRLYRIYLYVSDYPRIMKSSPIQTEYDMLFTLYTSGKWADKKLLSQYGQVRAIDGDPKKKEAWKSRDQFWNEMCKQYLDFDELFTAFLNFSGGYFIVMFPIQMISVLGIIYLNTSTAIFAANELVTHSMNMLAGLGIPRIFSLCSLGHQLETIRRRILINVFRVDGSTIPSKSDKINYKKFAEIVRSIPIQVNASGFFNVGRSNIPGILSALAGYFVILLQFKGSEKPPDSPESDGLAALLKGMNETNGTSGNATATAN